MTFPKALDAYTNALALAVLEGGGKQDPAVVDRKALAAKTELLKLFKAVERGESERVHALEKELQLTRRQLERIRKVLG